MLVKKISFPTSLKKIKDIQDDNIDVFVELDDGYTYSVVVITQKNLLTQMNKSNKDFVEPSCPLIIVRELTEVIIKEAIQAYAEGDAYWIKLNHLSTEFDIKVLDEMLEKLAE
ncbi:hypothetical protein [Alkaliphilus crotonatoxidans]